MSLVCGSLPSVAHSPFAARHTSGRASPTSVREAKTWVVIDLPAAAPGQDGRGRS